jgi:hypothetical protein
MFSGHTMVVFWLWHPKRKNILFVLCTLRQILQPTKEFFAMQLPGRKSEKHLPGMIDN